jgi:hypothetical protein
MATAHLTLSLDERRAPIVPLSVPPEVRTRIAAEIRSLLDRAEALIDFLNAADAPLLDMEPDADGEADPDADGEADPDEASAQPTILAPDWMRLQVVHRPTIAEQYAAYCRLGLPVPRTHRRGLFRRARS